MGNQASEIENAMEARFQYNYSGSSKLAITKLASMGYLPPLNAYGDWKIYTCKDYGRNGLVLLPQNQSQRCGLAVELLRNRDTVFYSAFYFTRDNSDNFGKYQGSIDKTLYQVCNVIDRIKRDTQSESNKNTVDKICDELLGRDRETLWETVVMVVAGVTVGTLILLGQLQAKK